MMLGLALVAVVAQQAPGADSLRDLARRLPEASLVVEARARPLDVRVAVAEAMERAVTVPAGADTELAVARRIAAAYAAAWSDSFFVRQLRRFDGWSADRRAAKVAADRLRVAGDTAYEREGPAAALRIWRRALARARAAGDSAGLAALFGNIGAAHLEEGRLDSAAGYLTRARRLAALVGDARVEANAVGMLAGLSEDRGDLEAARRQYEEALALRGRTGDSRGVAADHNNLGNLAQGLGDLAEAQRQYDSALALNQREGRDALAARNRLNLAGVAVLNGDFAAAEALYRDALAVFRGREQWPDVAATLLGLGQLETRRGDYPAAQISLREAGAVYARTGPPAEAVEARRALAAVLAAAGNMQSALDELRGAEADAGAAALSMRARAGLLLARADLSLQFNALADAERLDAQAELLYRRAADGGGLAEAQHARALLYLARQDYARAQIALAAALRTHLAAGNRRAAALARLALGQVARARGDTALAARHLARALAELEQLQDPVAAAAVLLEQGGLEADVGRRASAESLYRAGLARLDNRVAPEVAWQLHAGLALALREDGRLEAAARELRAALAATEQPRRSLARPERRSAFFADKWELYGWLAAVELKRGRPGAAFEASERLRSREMLELLALGRVAPPTDAAAALVAREQDLRRRIGELTDALDEGAQPSTALRGPDVSHVTAGARQALLDAEGQYVDLLLEIREAAPRHASMVEPRVAVWQDVASHLTAGEVFVEYLVSDSGSLAFLVTPDTLVPVDLGVTRRELARLVELARGTLASPPSDGDSLWRSPLRRLHQYLIAPLEETGLLASAKRLVIVPHAELNYLPFAALLGEGGEGYLVSRYELATTPSAAVWLALGQRPKRRDPSGTLALAPRGDALPASLAEVATVARRLGGVALTGPRASETAFLRAAPRQRVLHLATYGVLNRENPLFSFVDLASDSIHDGRLEVHEVLGLDLAADLVVLSACQTGLGSGMRADVPPGDDWIGLTRAFLHAGAANVVATLWPVEDLASGALMDRFYAAYEVDPDAVRSLALAQRSVLAPGAWAHPFYWAGFVAVEGSRARAAEAGAR